MFFLAILFSIMIFLIASYAPLYPAVTFQTTIFLLSSGRGLPDGVAAWLAAINGSAELTYVNPFALCRQSALPSKVPQNRYSALRSHIKSKAQPKRVNSVLRTSNNTRLVVVSLTLMAHYVESTKIKDNSKVAICILTYPYIYPLLYLPPTLYRCLLREK